MSRQRWNYRGERRLQVACYDEFGFPALVVPNDVWKQSSPFGDEGGLLCPSCICRRLYDLGIKTTGVFLSGPLCSEVTQ